MDRKLAFCLAGGVFVLLLMAGFLGFRLFSADGRVEDKIAFPEEKDYRVGLVNWQLGVFQPLYGGLAARDGNLLVKGVYGKHFWNRSKAHILIGTSEADGSYRLTAALLDKS